MRWSQVSRGSITLADRATGPSKPRDLLLSLASRHRRRALEACTRTTTLTSSHTWARSSLCRKLPALSENLSLSSSPIWCSMSQIHLLPLVKKIWEIIRKFSLSTAINKFQRPLKICQENNLRSTTRSSALRRRSHSMPAPCHPLPGPTTSSRTRTSPFPLSSPSLSLLPAPATKKSSRISASRLRDASWRRPLLHRVHHSSSMLRQGPCRATLLRVISWSKLVRLACLSSDATMTMRPTIPPPTSSPVPLLPLSSVDPREASRLWHSLERRMDTIYMSVAMASLRPLLLKDRAKVRSLHGRCSKRSACLRLNAMMAKSKCMGRSLLRAQQSRGLWILSLKSSRCFRQSFKRRVWISQCRVAVRRASLALLNISLSTNWAASLTRRMSLRWLASSTPACPRNSSVRLRSSRLALQVVKRLFWELKKMIALIVFSRINWKILISDIKFSQHWTPKRWNATEKANLFNLKLIKSMPVGWRE